jgi:hypothetical protein
VFRSLRDAGITWSIVRGDDVVRVQRRAGHKLIGTTQRYIVEAENRGASAPHSRRFRPRSSARLSPRPSRRPRFRKRRQSLTKPSAKGGI